MRKNDIKKKTKTEVHAFRCTEAETGLLQALAKECGLSLSRYIVESGLKHHPRKRLTEDEIEALNSLTMARADLIKVSNVLAGKTNEEKTRYFHSEKFMSWWIDAVATLIQYWYNLMEDITSSTK